MPHANIDFEISLTLNSGSSFDDSDQAPLEHLRKDILKEFINYLNAEGYEEVDDIDSKLTK